MTHEAKFKDLEIHCSKFRDLSDTGCQIQGPPVNFSQRRLKSTLISITNPQNVGIKKKSTERQNQIESLNQLY
jgi:hypothetical protein